MQEIDNLLEFIMEVEKLKEVRRKSRPVNLPRYENSAEHSWHVCLIALVCQEYANEPVDINRIIKMLIIHDLGEIDAGDTIIYHSETPELKAKEAAGLQRLFCLLPTHQAETYLQLWHEFEAGQTPDAKYAKAIDRIPSLLQNIYGDGHSWRENNISQEQIFAINSRIDQGSQPLWNALKSRLEAVIDTGVLV